MAGRLLEGRLLPEEGSTSHSERTGAVAGAAPATLHGGGTGSSVFDYLVKMGTERGRESDQKVMCVPLGPVEIASQWYAHNRLTPQRFVFPRFAGCRRSTDLPGILGPIPPPSLHVHVCAIGHGASLLKFLVRRMFLQNLLKHICLWPPAATPKKYSRITPPRKTPSGFGIKHIYIYI